MYDDTLLFVVSPELRGVFMWQMQNGKRQSPSLLLAIMGKQTGSDRAK